MRSTRRAPETFSVAAIDLFASATGMFILMTFALLPYFPNTSRSEAPELPVLDLVIALDTTGSMRDEVAGLLAEITITADVLGTLTKSAAARIIAYKDRCDPATALRASALRELDAAGVEALRSFVATLEAGSPQCDEDPEEDLAEALSLAVGTEWRAVSDRRAIVVIGDVPAHHDGWERASADARNFAGTSETRRTVSTVYVDHDRYTPEADDYVEGFMSSIADAGNGRYVRASENESVTGMILKAMLEN